MEVDLVLVVDLVLRRCPELDREVVEKVIGVLKRLKPDVVEEVAGVLKHLKNADVDSLKHLKTDDNHPSSSARFEESPVAPLLEEKGSGSSIDAESKPSSPPRPSHVDADYFLRKHPDLDEEEVKRWIRCLHEPLKADNPAGFQWFEDGLIWHHEKRKRGWAATQASPLVQIISITVEPNPNSRKADFPLKLFGSIHVEDAHQRRYDLYDRSRGKAEVVNSGGSLTLTGPHDECIPLSASLSIKFELSSPLRGGLFKVTECLNVDEQHEFDQVRSQIFKGEKVSAKVSYIVMPVATMAEVDLQISRLNMQTSKHDVPADGVDVGGSLIAKYDKTRGSDGEGEMQYLCTLFHKKGKEMEHVKSGEELPLLRSWVAVPSYATLVIALDSLVFGEERRKLRENEVKFPVYDTVFSQDKFVVDDISVRITVRWGYATPSSGKEISMPKRHPSRQAQGPSTVIPRFPSAQAERLPKGSPLTTIFSVFIGRRRCQALRLYGTIEVKSDSQTCYIFNKEKADAVELSDQCKTIPLQDPSFDLPDNPIEIVMDLKDANSSKLIKGYQRWFWSTVEPETVGYGRRICCVIRGNEDCYAAVHYSFFLHAVLARLRVSIRGGSSSDVSGSIVARYGGYHYLRSYDNDYFCTVLFNQIDKDALPLNGCDVQLSRSVVCVPADSWLVVDVAIKVGGQPVEGKGELKFGKKSLTIADRGFVVDISVEWQEDI